MPRLGRQGQLRQVQMQADIDAAGRLGAQLRCAGGPGRSVHQGTRRADAAQLEQMQHGLVDRTIQPEVVHTQADTGQRVRHVAAGWSVTFGRR